MTTVTLSLTPELYSYYSKHAFRESTVLSALREATLATNCANMQIAPEQGQFLSLLIELIGAKKTLDVGTFTGYSALAVAEALPVDGKVIACDINEEWTDIAKTYWAQAKVENKIDLRIAPAIETLKKLLDDGEAGSFDFCFIDADKQHYRDYYELSLKLVRSGGVIAIDNVLWHGQVAQEEAQDSRTKKIRELNAAIVADDRVTMSMLPIGDGLTIARKR